MGVFTFAKIKKIIWCISIICSIIVNAMNLYEVLNDKKS